MINMDPEVASIFTQSTSVSTSKGNSSNLMRAGARRRRTRAEIEEERLREQDEKNAVFEKLEMIEKMQGQMQQLQEKANWAEEWEARIAKLADAGKLKFKDDGEVDIVNDLAEQSHLQESRRKERENQIVCNPMTPPRLKERFDQNSD